MPELSRLTMHKPGTAQWDLLRPTQVPEATVQMMLVQLVFSADQLHRCRALARDFRTRFAETPGMDLARMWDARIDHRLNRPGPTALHIFSMILPASLMVTSIQAYRAEWSAPVE
ncbi:hypothetical protein NLY43_18960 [Mesorhizobium sp. C416B]|uniref:hypothetical protein n=1 Tax=unclassified Mesorhizobium TaxID=325217 RepID=UPI0003CF1AA1|nr:MULTISPECIES: hypothetical protein [unclassified Mesorhizobium]ESX51350.1 hypothetical protein X762_04875 [Mesorhizobium sp. LSHC426A00]ESX52723.1 hypothetical protein X761_22800 [Mesorhizobium sp. LSHC424B00]WJI60702.1 hypothetical protein NLY43_18960 [Mesorhizobium sp. C416B]